MFSSHVSGRAVHTDCLALDSEVFIGGSGASGRASHGVTSPVDPPREPIPPGSRVAAQFKCPHDEFKADKVCHICGGAEAVV